MVIDCWMRLIDVWDSDSNIILMSCLDNAIWNLSTHLIPENKMMMMISPMSFFFNSF